MFIVGVAFAKTWVVASGSFAGNEGWGNCIIETKPVAGSVLPHSSISIGVLSCQSESFTDVPDYSEMCLWNNSSESKKYNEARKGPRIFVVEFSW